MSLKELVALATEMKYPVEDWDKFKKNKKLMVIFFNKKEAEESK